MLAVVMCHLVWPDPTLHFDLVDRVLVNGWIGVDLFFVLSGFLITGILLDARGGPHYFKNFYARRALRIFPIYYLFLVVLFVWMPFGSWLFAHGMPQDFQRAKAYQAWYWTYLVNVLQTRVPHEQWFSTGHLWSLSVEEQFYLVWPAVVWFTPARRLVTVCMSAILLALVLRIWWVATAPEAIGAYVLMPMRADALAIGALLAILSRSETASSLVRRWYPLVGLASVAVALPILVAWGADLQHPMVATAGYSAIAMAFSALIAWIIDGGSSAALFSASALRRIGRVSYGGYLYHLPIIGLAAPLRDRLHAFGQAGAPRMLVAHLTWALVVVSATLVVAAVSYRWIEQPFLDRKARFVR